ncbi:hypothetical protein BB561_004240 [Smittium simulii]|uniref:25S rRNA (uridine-N(3))-methyltransferase BMT5-like domain-containing protein n=1 Tax=Smittium simulii TaxID=133385 RepID=A0A2T9YHC9_9FUNG|nr:hypothetical protein BB561_004240 [Smittium simulii]
MVKRKKRSLQNALSEFIDKSKKFKSSQENQSLLNSKNKTAAQNKQKHHIKVPDLYSLSDYILLVGEGNFSFANSLAQKLGSGLNIIATSYDSQKEVFSKYQDAETLIKSFTSLGGTVYHNVDCADLQKIKPLKKKKFTRIVFNFPHLGHNVADQERSIKSHQDLLLNSEPEVENNDDDIDNIPGFDKIKNLSGNNFDLADDLVLVSNSAFKASESTNVNLNVDGELHVTLKSGEPYNSWNIRSICKKSQKLMLKTTVPFIPANYPGYEHRRTKGFIEGTSKNENLEIIANKPKTFILTLKPNTES